MFKSQLFATLFLNLIFLVVIDAQVITQPPESVTTAQGTNATFTCHGNGDVIWEISGSQVLTEQLVGLFAQEKVYVPKPTPSVSQLIMTATEMNNFTRTIQCLVDPGVGVGPIEESSTVHLLVYAEPNPPSDLVITVDGLNLVATWTEPFSLEGEEISYVIAVSNSSATMDEVTVDTPTYVFTGPTTGPRDCAEYTFSVLSKNNFSKSSTGLSGRKNIPTEPLLITKSDVQLEVSLESRVSAIITFNSADPCPSYPVTIYIFNITERDTNTLTASIRHTNTLPLVVDGSNGLVPDQMYRLVIEAENSVGSTLSEEILISTYTITAATSNYNPMHNESTWKTAVILTVVLVVVFTLVASVLSLLCYKVGIHKVLSASSGRNSETQVVKARTNTEFQFVNDSVVYEDINDETIVNTDSNYIETTPNVVYGFSTDSIKTTPNELYGVNTDGIKTTPNKVYGLLRK